MKAKALLCLILSLPLWVVGQVNKEEPFPANRLRDFYANQARIYLNSDQSLPLILPQFPGLDGGSWGHWGQNPESDNTDSRLNEVDTSGLLMQVTRHFGTTTHKAVNVRVGEYTVLFDPERMAFVDAWKGDLVKWASRRYGITSGVEANGERVGDLSGSKWQLPLKIDTKYHGFIRRENEVLFLYEIGGKEVLHFMSVNSGQLKQHIRLGLDFPGEAKLVSSLEPEIAPFSLKALELEKEQPRIWSEDQAVKTRGELGQEDGPYVIDTITVPYRDQNPFKSPMRIGGMDILPDGRIAVCTLMGDVWIVDGIDENLEKVTWTRFASGLHQPLGLVAKNGPIKVIGRDQLTRLVDSDGNGEADLYECVTNEFPTAKGNSFALTLHQDNRGRYYWFTRSNQFGMTRFAVGEKPESIATGLRGTNGTGVSPDGSIVFAMPQEGTWQPASGIFEVGGGSYHGHFGPKEQYGKHGYEMPMCFIPRGIDNSSGDIVFLPEDNRLGPLSGQIIGTSFGYCSHYLVLREKIGDGVQGGIVPLAGDFLSGAHRLRFNEHDGHIYVAGTDGWQSYAKENGSLQRLRYVGGNLHLPTKVETRENGLIVRFNTKISPESVKLERAFAEQWNYLYSGAYGSPEYSVKYPGQQGHDPVQIRSLHLIEDGTALFVEIPQLHPVMQFHLYLELESDSGEKFQPDIYYSIFNLAKPYTEFEGYELIEKEPWNDFPVPGENPVDPRLAKQETMGKIVGDESRLSAIARLRVDAIAGLQFAPKKLQVKAGSRVALTVTNTDMSMPHNFVLVQPDRLQAVGEGSMKLAAGPDGYAKHYVINDPGVIAMSPILQGGASYIVYFDAPREPGNYPYLCTFPGHWQVTRGFLTVIE